jgi:hypothetical protein
MQFCPITPIEWLDMFGRFTDTHMVLGQFCNISKYNTYYRKATEHGQVVILDNGAYETTPMNFKDLLQIIRFMKPTYYVLPDEPNTFRDSNEMSMEFLKFAKDQGGTGESKPLWVVHAEDGDLPSFINSYQLGIHYAAGICLSRLTNHYGLSNEVSPLRRVQFLNHLKTLKHYPQSGKYIHCLGMLNGSLRELSSLHDLGVTSIDSSAPVWRGLMGYTLDQPWPDFPFSLKPAVIATALMENQRPRGEYTAEHNLKEVLAACHHRQPQFELAQA